MRTAVVLLVVLVALVASVSAAPTKPVIKSVSAPADMYSGQYWYHDRDQKVPHLPAKLACIKDCATVNPVYRATLSLTNVVFGVMTVNSKYVGFGQGPAPQIIGGCQDNNFTAILADDGNTVNNIFAAYSPCNKFPGGASIYTKNSNAGFLSSVKNNIMNDIAIMKEAVQPIKGAYQIIDRNFASHADALTLACVKDCVSKVPTYKGTFGSSSFQVTFAPDGLVAFGTLTVQDHGKACGSTRFTVVVPPQGFSAGAAMLAAAEPLPACSYAGQAFRIVANK